MQRKEMKYEDAVGWERWAPEHLECNKRARAAEHAPMPKQRQQAHRIHFLPVVQSFACLNDSDCYLVPRQKHYLYIKMETRSQYMAGEVSASNANWNERAREIKWRARFAVCWRWLKTINAKRLCCCPVPPLFFVWTSTAYWAHRPGLFRSSLNALAMVPRMECKYKPRPTVNAPAPTQMANKHQHLLRISFEKKKTGKKEKNGIKTTRPKSNFDWNTLATRIHDDRCSIEGRFLPISTSWWNENGQRQQTTRHTESTSNVYIRV